MPLRISPENDRPAEPVAATRPPAEAIDDRVYRPSYRPEPQPEKINVILKLVIGGIFVYVAAMAVGLLGMMFPHQQHDLVRAVKQGVAFVRPEPQRPRALVMPQPTAAPAAVDTRSKTVQPAARRKHYSNGKSPNFGTIEVGDSTQRRTITPKPTAPTASITVSVGDSRSAQPAN